MAGATPLSVKLSLHPLDSYNFMNELRGATIRDSVLLKLMIYLILFVIEAVSAIVRMCIAFSTIVQAIKGDRSRCDPITFNPVMQVPLEIVGQIIAYVEESSSLRACSLVDRAWLPFTRELLYNKVTISPSEQGRAKIEFFEQSPHLAPFVRTLSVFCRPSPEIAPAMTRLPIIFPNTEYLHLMGLPRFQWTALPSEFTESFQQLVASGLLKSLYLTWFHFQEEDVLGDLLRSCSRTLEALRLRNLGNPIDITLIAPGEAPEISFPELSTLALASVATSSPTSSYRLATPSLKFLSWGSTVTTLPYLINILPRSSMSAVTTFELSLSLDPSQDNPYAVPPVPLGFFPDAWCLPDVRTLTIAMRYPTFDNDNPLDTALSYVTRCLQQIPNFDVIETINIELNPNVIAESPSWKHLDAVFADIHTHGSLKSVVIHPMPPPVWLPHCAVLEARGDEE